MKKLQPILLLFFAFSTNANAELLLFGGNSHDDYLGCYDCSKYVSDSICNKYGTYGNKYSSDSVWNKYSSGDDVPVLVDRSGNFYGYFTINCYRKDAFNDCRNFKDAYERFGDLDELRNAYCD